MVDLSLVVIGKSIKMRKVGIVDEEVFESMNALNVWVKAQKFDVVIVGIQKDRIKGGGKRYTLFYCRAKS